MRPARDEVVMHDDLQFKDLHAAIAANIKRLNENTSVTDLRFGSEVVSKLTYVEGLQKILDSLSADLSGEQTKRLLTDEFELFEVYGDSTGWGNVFVTSYFEPVIQGSLKKTSEMTQALYELPSDLLHIEMGEFAQSFPVLQSYHDVIKEKSRDGLLRGRLRTQEGQLTQVVPYYSRAEIDDVQQIKKQAKVIAYVHPVDAFFLQIQGSGQVVLPNRRIIRVGYAGQNGHPYSPIGKLLFHVIPKEQMTMQKIESYLKEIPKEEARKIMNYNASYVFFKEQNTDPITAFGTEVVPGRTIATDPKYFPKGALGFLVYEKPVIGDNYKFEKSSRLVLDQDTGGAIRGPGRVDLFWGRGPEAAKHSGVMRNPGRLYYILPKKRAL